MKPASPPIAVINSNEDIIDAIRLLLSEEGFASVTTHVTDLKRGRTDLNKFLEQHNPKIVIYDIAPPYDENWRFFELVRSSKETEGITFILTTTNKERLTEIVGENVNAIEIVGKPFDLEAIINAVKTAE